MRYRPRTLLPSLFGLAGPLICAAGFVATLAVLGDDPDVYFVAGPYVPVGIAGFVFRKSRWTSTYWLAVASGIAVLAAAILVGEGNVLASRRNDTGRGMSIGIAGLAQWTIVVIAIPIGIVIWVLENPRMTGRLFRNFPSNT
jgi:hypothetical protein